MSSFHPLEVVGRGSETQLQVGENLKRIAYLTGNLANNYTSVREDKSAVLKNRLHIVKYNLVIYFVRYHIIFMGFFSQIEDADLFIRQHRIQ